MPTPRRPSTEDDPDLRALATVPVTPRRASHPLARILHAESASGAVLLAAAALALAFASSPLAPLYHHAIDAPRLRAGTLDVSLRFIVDDVLMTAFFLVVGLEIRREIQDGALSTAKQAALPLAAALGGMVAPALLYTVLNRAPDGAPRGWGVPMATDIAFAVGVLSLLGSRVPPALRALLLSLAVIDDLGSVLVIALAYSPGLHADGVLVAGAGIALAVALRRLGSTRAVTHVVPLLVVWAGFHRAGIHPALAGVVVGLLVPAGEATRASGPSGGSETARAPSPATRLERSLRPWVDLGIMPLFAFANAGVTWGAGGVRGMGGITAGIVAGLALGKPLGILVATFVALRLRLAVRPPGVGWRELLVLGVVAGIGFTMALFVATLAFPSAAQLDEAKIAILAASAVAGVVALLLGALLLHPSRVHDGAAGAERGALS